jgi:hypothetical protein
MPKDKEERKTTRGRPRSRWVDNIKMDLRDIGWYGMDWIGFIWLRIEAVEGSCEHGN